MKKIKQVLLLLGIIIDTGWIWFVLNLTFFGTEINYLERVPWTLPFIFLLIVLFSLFLKLSKPTTKKRTATLICILTLTVLLSPVILTGDIYFQTAQLIILNV